MKISLADDVIDLIVENLAISEVYEDHDILIYVKGNLKAECEQWIQSVDNPEDVFDEQQLNDWASANGWVRE
jgi:hypothetical protein